MSLPRIVSDMVVTGIRILGRASAAAGQQAMANLKHKPENNDAPRASSSSSKSEHAITSQLQMTIDEARMILNVKKDDPMEIIQRQYDAIFTANGPPPEPAPSANSPQPGKRPSRAPAHSHYLQSKVYRALERIRAERAEEPTPPAGEVRDAAGQGTDAAPTVTTAAPPPPPPPGTGSTGQGGGTSS
ncbi:hypothetical protein BCR39DRAFT_525787 [Naematelia encephala]|uniref:Mitochondrial import inner membrane translocase subunit TIM16 n=1 Tax=Naematelia encephala TaxID=71784 RepID=A0A1Y2BBX0_9TREE|nr:hypothetical protein BCR39DRAFT_525787 [Naematelia encephala]